MEISVSAQNDAAGAVAPGSGCGLCRGPELGLQRSHLRVDSEQVHAHSVLQV